MEIYTKEDIKEQFVNEGKAVVVSRQESGKLCVAHFNPREILYF